MSLWDVLFLLVDGSGVLGTVFSHVVSLQFGAVFNIELLLKKDTPVAIHFALVTGKTVSVYLVFDVGLIENAVYAAVIKFLLWSVVSGFSGH